MSNQKTPTTILLTPERKFHSFGYAARDFYHDLDPNEAKQWLYLEKFKMKLHTTGVSQPLPGPKCPRAEVPPGFPTLGGPQVSPEQKQTSTHLILETAWGTPRFGPHDTFSDAHTDREIFRLFSNLFALEIDPSERHWLDGATGIGGWGGPAVLGDPPSVAGLWEIKGS